MLNQLDLYEAWLVSLLQCELVDVGDSPTVANVVRLPEEDDAVPSVISRNADMAEVTLLLEEVVIPDTISVVESMFKSAVVWAGKTVVARVAWVILQQAELTADDVKCFSGMSSVVGVV